MHTCNTYIHVIYTYTYIYMVLEQAWRQYVERLERVELVTCLGCRRSTYIYIYTHTHTRTHTHTHTHTHSSM